MVLLRGRYLWDHYARCEQDAHHSQVGVDDALLFIALVGRTLIFPTTSNAKGPFSKLFFIGQMIAIAVSAHEGLGKPTSPSTANTVLKVTLWVLDCAR